MPMLTKSQDRIRWFLTGLLGLTLLTISCSPRPAHYVTEPSVIPDPPISTRIYFYPNQGQTAEQQDRDRYECYLWAVQKSGFDPSSSQLVPHQRVLVTPEPPTGYDTVAGAATGAILGAIIGSPGSTGEGAVIGALAGAAIGASSDAARQEQADRVQSRYDQQTANRYSDQERKARNYRRAMSACLEGRDYTVH